MRYESHFGNGPYEDCFPLLTQLQVDETNRGHRHLVLCHSSKAVQSGLLCNSVQWSCVETRLCLRKIDVSNCLCLFEFRSDNEAQAVLRASVPSITFTKPQAYFWKVESIDSNHIGHSQPYRECEKNLYLTYAMKTTAKLMTDSGCSAADIADYLTSRGCTGTLTDARLKYHVNDVRKDMDDFTAIPKPSETDAEALIRSLQEKKCRYIYLYTNLP